MFGAAVIWWLDGASRLPLNSRPFEDLTQPTNCGLNSRNPNIVAAVWLRANKVRTCFIQLIAIDAELSAPLKSSLRLFRLVFVVLSSSTFWIHSSRSIYSRHFDIFLICFLPALFEGDMFFLSPYISFSFHLHTQTNCFLHHLWFSFCILTLTFVSVANQCFCVLEQSINWKVLWCQWLFSGTNESSFLFPPCISRLGHLCMSTGGKQCNESTDVGSPSKIKDSGPAVKSITLQIRIIWNRKQNNWHRDVRIIQNKEIKTFPKDKTTNQKQQNRLVLFFSSYLIRC